MTNPVHFFKQQLCSFLISSTFILAPIFASQAHAENDALAEVNGTKIHSKMLSIVANSRESGPLSGLDESQDELLENLISTELLFQAAQKQKLQEEERIALELELSHKTLLAQFYVMQYMEQLEFEETALRAAYDKETDRVMLRMAYWAFTNQIEAQAFLQKALNSNAKSVLVAGEELPWQALESLPFAEFKEAASLKTGQWLPKLTQEGNRWFAWQCLEESIISKPSFEEAREAIRQELATTSLHKHIAELREQANVIKHSQVNP